MSDPSLAVVLVSERFEVGAIWRCLKMKAAEPVEDELGSIEVEIRSLQSKSKI